MYKTAPWFAGCVVLAMLLPQGGAMAGSSTPESGTYQGEVFTNSISGSGCLDKAGYDFVASMSFGGLSAGTDYIRALETGTGFAVTSVQTLSVTGGKGTTSPSGTFTWVGSGIGGSWNESGTFTGTVTEIGTHAFILQLTEKYSSCTEDLNIPLVRVGVNQ